jgi:hypothetical protein
MPPPGVEIHWRSWIAVPSKGFAVQVCPLSEEVETVALPSHRSVM